VFAYLVLDRLRRIDRDGGGTVVGAFVPISAQPRPTGQQDVP
jgi:hypothetical protein